MTTSNIKANIQCDIHKIWEIISAVEDYHTWRRDVAKTAVIDEQQFIEYTKDGYSTMFTVTAKQPHSRWELDVENSHIKGHWTVVFAPKGCETEIDFTACVTAKGLFTRPTGKSVFEKMYLKKEQEQFVMDLKESTGS